MQRVLTFDGIIRLDRIYSKCNMQTECHRIRKGGRGHFEGFRHGSMARFMVKVEAGLSWAADVISGLPDDIFRHRHEPFAGLPGRSLVKAT